MAKPPLLIAAVFMACAPAPLRAEPADAPPPAGALRGDVEPRLSFTPPDPMVRTVALTFDACSGAVDLRILDALIEARARATIFVTHRWLRKNDAALTVLKAHPDLFEIENHGENHIPVVTDAVTVFGVRTAGTLEAARREIEGGAKAVEAATGKRPRWFRGATARYSRDAIAAARADGYEIAGFSLNGDMGASLGQAASARRIAAARTGDVVIAHINQPLRPAGAGVAEAIRALARSGARFVRLDEVATRSDDGPVLHPRREVDDRFRVGRDERRLQVHPARSDEDRRLGAVRGEPDPRDHAGRRLKARPNPVGLK